MRLFINSQTGDLVIEHLGKKLEWRAIKSVEQKEFDIFKEINEYWKFCDIDKQNKIFDIYQRIHAIFSEYIHQNVTIDVSETIPQLRPVVAELFEQHKQEDVFNWYRYHSGIAMPTSIPALYDESEGRSRTRDQTYDRPDYERLIVLSVSIRCMIPIWGEFIIRTEGVVGNHLKEYWAMTLLHDANIMSCAAMVRLRRYIDAMVERASIDLSVSLKITSVENFNDWMLSLTAVRRLTRGDLRVGAANTNLAAFIYGFLKMKLEGMKNAAGEVKIKKPISASTEGENNLSDLEGFKIKQAVTTDAVQIGPEYLKRNMEYVLTGGYCDTLHTPDRLQLLARELGMSPAELSAVTMGSFSKQPFVETQPLIKYLNPVYDISELVKQAYDQTRYLESETIEDCQLLLCGFLMSNYISIRSIPHMNKTDVQRLIAFSAATMWSYKQKDLACMMLNVYRVPILSDNMIRPADVRSRITKENAESLRKIFPYVRPGRGGKPADSGAVFSDIESIVDMMKERDIHYNLPKQWCAELGIVNGSIYHAPTNIRNILAEYILRINHKQELQPLY